MSVDTITPPPLWFTGPDRDRIAAKATRASVAAGPFPTLATDVDPNRARHACEQTQAGSRHTIKRRPDNAADFTEIGFGSSSAAANVDRAAYDVESQIQNSQWETGDGMPDPSEADRG